MFVRKLTVHRDQNNSYEITINGFISQKHKRNKKRNFQSPLWAIFLSVKAEVGIFINLISSSTQLGEHPNFGLNAEEGFP